MKKQITREIDLDDDGIHCSRDCMFLHYREMSDCCLLYDECMKAAKTRGLYSGKVERCKECLEENPAEEKKPECKHCWHTLPSYNLTNPPQRVEICCWCGLKKTTIENQYGTAGSWTSSQHGPYYNIRPMY